MTKLDQVNAALAKADQKAGFVTATAGTMLAIGASRPGLEIAIVFWAFSLGCALIALFPILRGDHGFMAWAEGREGASEDQAVRGLSRMARFKYRWIQASIVTMFLSAIVLGVTR